MNHINNHSGLTRSRRQFLASIGGAGAGLMALPAISETAAKPKGFSVFHGVQLAIATICTDGFGNHHHEPAFRIIPQLGFKNVEFNLWYADTITPDYIRSLKRRCYETGLRPISLQGTSFGGEGSSGIIKDFSHKLVLMQGCETLGCQIVKCTGSARGSNGGLKSVIAVCRELAPVAEEKGILVVLENHANNVLERIEDYEVIFSKIDSPNIGMCLDTGHFEGVNVDLHKVIDKFHKRILHVDLKDCHERGKGHDTVVFGRGVTDFESFLKHLYEKGYSGYLVVEQAWREPKGDWKSDLKKAYEFFRSYQRGPNV